MGRPLGLQTQIQPFVGWLVNKVWQASIWAALNFDSGDWYGRANDIRQDEEHGEEDKSQKRE